MKLVDACADEAGTCLALQIEGSAGLREIDALSLDVRGGGIDSTRATMLPGGEAATLPVAVGLSSRASRPARQPRSS